MQYTNALGWGPIDRANYLTAVGVTGMVSYRTHSGQQICQKWNPQTGVNGRALLTKPGQIDRRALLTCTFDWSRYAREGREGLRPSLSDDSWELVQRRDAPRNWVLKDRSWDLREPAPRGAKMSDFLAHFDASHCSTWRNSFCPTGAVCGGGCGGDGAFCTRGPSRRRTG